MSHYSSGLASLFSTHARRADLAPKVKCPQCGREYTLGVDGTVDGCDDCTKTERLPQGYVCEQCCCYEIEGDNDNCPIHGEGGE